MYEDKTLVCNECGQEFVFSAGEQEIEHSRIPGFPGNAPPIIKGQDIPWTLPDLLGGLADIAHPAGEIADRGKLKGSA